MSTDNLYTLTQKMKFHDWNYSYSDDYGTWRRGKQSWDELLTLCKKYDMEDVRSLWMKFASPEYQVMFEKIFAV